MAKTAIAQGEFYPFFYIGDDLPQQARIEMAQSENDYNVTEIQVPAALRRRYTAAMKEMSEVQRALEDLFAATGSRPKLTVMQEDLNRMRKLVEAGGQVGNPTPNVIRALNLVEHDAERSVYGLEKFKP